MPNRDKRLILLIDDDESISHAIGEYLALKGFSVITAHNGATALDLFKTHSPHLVVADLCMPVMNGIQFLVELRKRDSLTPVIITTGYPDMNSAIDAIHNGAYDYLVKPYQPEVLLQKVKQALTSVELAHENTVLSNLVTLHETANRLNATQSLEDLLDVTFQSCCSVLKADGGSIQLIDKKTNELVIERSQGVQSPIVRSSLTNDDEWTISKWVIKNNKSVLLTGTLSESDVPLKLEREDIASAVSVPLRIPNEVIGAIHLNRSLGRVPFTQVDLNTLEVFASQAGISINNAVLNKSVRQKLAELSLISTYSEQLMGLVERQDVVSRLLDTIQSHFPFDVVGVLMTRKRFHEFMYWSRHKLRDGKVPEIISDVVKKYNAATNEKVLTKRVVARASDTCSPVSESVLPVQEFNSVIPIVLDDIPYGAVYISAVNEPQNLEDILPLLNSIINQTRIALNNAKLYDDIKENYIKTIKALAIAVDSKDTYTHGHSENVMNIAETLAIEMDMSEKAIGIIRDAGLLHDIGKIGIPGYILNKPGPLTYDEFNGVMKTHTTMGANIVRDVPFLRDLYSLILYHHEHFDGSGYPEGKKGEDIPLGARILHVADAFEAMTSNRPYRHSLGKKEAVKRLADEKGHQFDPAIVEVFLRVAEKKGWLT